MALELCYVSISGMCNFFDNGETGVLPITRAAAVLTPTANITAAVDASGVNYYGGGGTTLVNQYVLTFEPGDGALAGIFTAALTEYRGANPRMAIIIQNYQSTAVLTEMGTLPGSTPTGVTGPFALMCIIDDIALDNYGTPDGFSTGFYGQYSLKMYALESGLVSAGLTKVNQIIPAARPGVPLNPNALEPDNVNLEIDRLYHDDIDNANDIPRLRNETGSLRPINLLFQYTFSPSPNN